MTSSHVPLLLHVAVDDPSIVYCGSHVKYAADVAPSVDILTPPPTGAEIVGQDTKIAQKCIIRV